MRTLTLALLLTVAPLSGCVSTSSSRVGEPGPDRFRITRADLLALPSGSAFSAVERLHRDWLRGRAATARTSTGRSYPHVFLDGRPYGTLETLHQFGIESINEIRFIPPPDATTRYGTGYPAGIIEVITPRGHPYWFPSSAQGGRPVFPSTSGKQRPTDEPSTPSGIRGQPWTTVSLLGNIWLPIVDLSVDLP